MEKYRENYINNKQFYDIFEEQVREVGTFPKKPTLLMHACCCPCSSYCLELLSKVFDITVFFYNPNIDEIDEYEKRYGELIRLTEEADFAMDVKIVRGEYEPELFYEMAKGREKLPERSERCYDCYLLRMRKTVQYAAENGFDYFTTTLSISPYKNSEWINEIGMKLERELRIKANEGLSEENSLTHQKMKIPVFLFSDFKKKNGYKRSIELSKEYGLYRQDYCGCVFSKAERDLKKQQNSLE